MEGRAVRFWCLEHETLVGLLWQEGRREEAVPSSTPSPPSSLLLLLVLLLFLSPHPHFPLPLSLLQLLRVARKKKYGCFCIQRHRPRQHFTELVNIANKLLDYFSIIFYFTLKQFTTTLYSSLVRSHRGKKKKRIGILSAHDYLTINQLNSLDIRL